MFYLVVFLLAKSAFVVPMNSEAACRRAMLNYTYSNAFCINADTGEEIKK